MFHLKNGNKLISDLLLLCPFFAFFTALFLLTAHNSFFWDKDILFSRISFWLIDNHFKLILPNTMDPGYPPALAYLLAISWKLFGKSLFMAHLIMFPFTLGLVWQSYRLIAFYFPRKNITVALIILFLNTTILTQTILFSTDLVMLFFLVLAINSVLRNHRKLIIIAITGLLFSHMRGLMAGLMVGIFDLYKNLKPVKFQSIFRLALPYLPGLILFLSWVIFHYSVKGWVVYHPDSPWALCYQRVGFAGFIKNFFIVIWRLVDFGYIFLWFSLFYSIYLIFTKKLIIDNTIKDLLVLLALSLIVTTPAMLIYKVMSSHRYLIPVYFVLGIIVAYFILIKIDNPRTKRVFVIIVIVGLVSGNFWVYPDKIAKGWDATLAHIPYYHLRKEMISNIDYQEIPFDEVGSEVPNTSEIKYIDLNGDSRSFPKANLKKDKYVFYSNIYNMFTDKDIDELKHSWVLEKKYSCLQVYVALYRNPHYIKPLDVVR